MTYTTKDIIELLDATAEDIISSGSNKDVNNILFFIDEIKKRLEKTSDNLCS